MGVGGVLSYCAGSPSTGSLLSGPSQGIRTSGRQTGNQGKQNCCLLESHQNKYGFGRNVTDGDDFSLTVKDTANPDLALWDDRSGWDASSISGGTPGEADTDY